MVSKIFEKLKLVSSAEGTVFDLPDPAFLADGFNREYLMHVSALFQNPALTSELERALFVLVRGSFESDDDQEKESAKLATKGLLAFHDRLKYLHEVWQEEKRKQEGLPDEANSPGTEPLD